MQCGQPETEDLRGLWLGSGHQLQGGGGGLQNGREVLPLQKGGRGAGKVLADLKGAHKVLE